MRLLIFICLCGVLMSAAVDIEQLLKSMTLRQKIAQMAQLDISTFFDEYTQTVDYDKIESYVKKYEFGSMLNSIFSFGDIKGEVSWTASEWRFFINKMQSFTQETENKIPIIYGIDSIHGGTYIYKSALFPQAINTAATFNTSKAYIQGAVTAKDTRAAAIPWIFAPVLGLALQPAWARFEETFGEDAYLAGQMGASIIRGLQDVTQDGGVPTRAAACMKHFIAYSDPVDGHDRSPVMLPDRVLQQLYRPSFQAAIDAGVLTAMESYQEVGGVPMVSSSAYLQTLLRSSWNMNFTGMMVTDYKEIYNLNNWHMVSSTEEEATTLAISETSIDMSMIPIDANFIDYLENAVNSSKIPESRIDESARRILQLKETLGMFDDPVPSLEDRNVGTVGQQSDWDKSLDSALESITLLKNNGTLPLDASKSFFLTGPNADSLTSQSGGWSFHWQGASSDSDFSRGKTVKQAIIDRIGGSLLSYYPGPTIDATDLSGVNMTYAINNASKASCIIVCIGEGTYAEKPGDIDDLAIAAGQVAYIRSLRESLPTIPIVTILIEGRPRLLSTIPSDSNAVLMSYVPGPLGGKAISDTLFGANNPSGRLPYTYPMKAADIPYTYDHKPGDRCKDGPCTPEWSFGTGLSYTSFSYKNTTINANTFDENGEVVVQTTVKNTGSLEGSHSVLLFIFDMYRRVTPEYKQLKRFTKLNLAAGASSTVTFTIPMSDLKYIGVDSRYILESGSYLVGLGPDTDCRTDSSSCLSFSLDLSSSYSPICDMACNSEMYSQAMSLCQGETTSIPDCRSLCTRQQWNWNYVSCLENTANGLQACYNSAPQCYSPTYAENPDTTSECSDEASVDKSYFYLFVGIAVACGVIAGVLATYFAIRLGWVRIPAPSYKGFDDKPATSRGNVLKAESSGNGQNDETRTALLGQNNF